MSSIYPTPSVTLQQPSMGPDAFKGFDQNWNVGLCNCCDDISQCCYANFCWCCFLKSLANSIDESAWSCLCVPYALAMYRTKVRAVLRIQGGVCNDHCVTSFCGFCAALQMRNELKHHGIS